MGHETVSKAATAYAHTNWDQYLSARPAYPPSLAKHINDYHASHSSERGCLVDIGAGIGIGSLQFAPEYSVVHLSDPSAANTKDAPNFLRAQLSKQQCRIPKIETSVCNGENIHEHVDEQSVDLVVCATAAHFMDGPELAQSVAKVLKPRGTFACFTYGTPHFPELSPEFHEAFNNAIGIMFKSTFKPGESESTFTRALSNLTSGSGGLDFILFAKELYEDVIRVRINIGEGAPLSVWPWIVHAPIKIGGVASQVSAEEQVLDYRSGVDAEAEGWSNITDRDFIHQLLASLEGAQGRRNMDGETAAHHERWESLLLKEAPQGKVKITWPVFVALATRK